MKQTSELFELIKSLNKNEKRYFRLQSSLQKGSKNYLMLFDAIDNQTYYDEKKIKIKYSSEKFVRQFAFTKNHLYSLIMKSLINYYNEKSIDSKIHSAISECKILFGKALYRQYFYKISKAKLLALKHERFGYFLQILDMERIIIRKQEIQTLKGDAIYNEALEALEKIKNMFEYYQLAAHSLNDFRSFGTRRNVKQDEKISRILNSKLMLSPENAISTRTKESYYRIYEIIYNTTANYKKMLESLEMRYHAINENPYPFEDYIIDYKCDVLAALVDAHIKENNTLEAEKYLKIYKNSKIRNEAERVTREIFFAFAEFQIFMKKNEINKATKLIPTLEKSMVTYKNKMLIDTELSILFQVVKCRMLEKNFDLALKAANSLLSHPLLEKRADYESYLRVMNLIIHFELKNYSLLKYLIISTYRFLYKTEKLYAIETIILKFIRKLPEIKNEDDLMFTFVKFKKMLEKLKNDKYEKNVFDYFDFLNWVDKKIKR